MRLQAIFNKIYRFMFRISRKIVKTGLNILISRSKEWVDISQTISMEPFNHELESYVNTNLTLECYSGRCADFLRVI
uniref:Uncharacterized protein n=1 Tax=uncultured Hafnia sp. TaxID=374604 RepID=A0A3G2C833_9GAMM|nr:hypothetical protein [uncultured Hafnia sp.]